MTPSTATAVRFAPPVIGRDEIDEVVAALESGWLSTGPRVAQFETAFAAYAGAPHALALNSCTAALHLALLAHEVGPEDEVVTTPLTFCATANVAIHAGATPVFADIDPDTWNLSPAAAAAAVTSKTRALVPVHFGGRPVDVVAFRALADRHSLALIEDAAHAVEAVAAGRKIGSTADVTCFSFYATKNLTTGEGGMLTTASDRIARFARTASQHGISRDGWARYNDTGSPHYDVLFPGFKYNMMDLQAAIGLHQLAGLSARAARRQALWRIYDEGLADLPLVVPSPVPDGDVHARHLYSVLVGPDSGWTRDELITRLASRGISTSVHFRALHLHPYYRARYRLTRGMFPVAERVSDQIVSLPLGGGMTDDEAWTVVDALRRAIPGRTR
ncbi:MAG: DegT/DnrJ/EryC1/StrS aminotransferase family protein [Acidobacteria bacterium]|nr:DegT/DnrJ/EryC1/StrS aminotransferase family protein [Acidobacteriota bacterium]